MTKILKHSEIKTEADRLQLYRDAKAILTKKLTGLIAHEDCYELWRVAYLISGREKNYAKCGSCPSKRKATVIAWIEAVGAEMEAAEKAGTATPEAETPKAEEATPVDEQPATQGNNDQPFEAAPAEDGAGGGLPTPEEVGALAFSLGRNQKENPYTEAADRSAWARGWYKGHGEAFQRGQTDFTEKGSPTDGNVAALCPFEEMVVSMVWLEGFQAAEKAAKPAKVQPTEKPAKAPKNQPKETKAKKPATTKEASEKTTK